MSPDLACDVLVVGAGIAGLLIARALRDAGLTSIIVDPGPIGDAQSNHSHGYLHKGYIYLRSERRLVHSLVSSGEDWKLLLQELQVDASNSDSRICFTNAYTAAAASSSWRTAGLDVEETPPPPGFRSDMIAAAFRSSEPSYEFDAVLRALLGAIKDVAWFPGRAIRLYGTRGRVDAVAVEGDESTQVLRAQFYIFAAGVDNPRLMASGTTFYGRAAARTSYMLVLEGDDLPPISAIFPEHELYGLFIVSRNGPPVRWLVSDYVSFAGTTQTERAARMWTAALISTLHRYSTITHISGLRCGLYHAPKAELRADPRQLGSYAIEDYGFDNAITVAPTKITLAPVLARETLKWVTSRVSERSGSPHYSGVRSLGSAVVGAERWKRIELHPIECLQQAFVPDDLYKGAGEAPPA